MAEILEAVLEEPLQVETVAWPESSPPAKLTWEQASKLAQGKPFELINGRIQYKMADDKHADAQARLCIALGTYFKTNPVGLVRTEYTLRLWPDKPHEGRVPDLSVILNENLKEERYGSTAPDLAIEIVSRDDGWADLFEKAELYFEKGSRLVWFVDPMQKGVMVVTPEDRKWVKDILVCPELLPGFTLNVLEIFEWPSVAQSVAAR
ncbi:Uma2 family endonuclease [candidate division KSB1 bacterium]|nr:Uma2 family endonuclease [candidate division KSB1 bacterium]